MRLRLEARRAAVAAALRNAATLIEAPSPSAARAAAESIKVLRHVAPDLGSSLAFELRRLEIKVNHG